MQSESDKKVVAQSYQQLKEACEKSDLIEDTARIEKAFHFANQAHIEMKRKTGEPYIIHPIAVARTVVEEIGLDEGCVIAALLHDVVEDTQHTLEDIVTGFGQDIATIIDGLTKISGTYKEGKTSLQYENFKKIILTLSGGAKVIMIKLADRLHNMRTLASMPSHKQVKIAAETLFLYAPLAHRLGLYRVKKELENLALKYEHPEEYQKLNEQYQQSQKDNAKIVEETVTSITKKLNAHKIEHTILNSPKSISSIWRKIHQENIPFEEIPDILSLKIIFKPVSMRPVKNQCWDIYSYITDIYKPKPNTIEDWITIAKTNSYQALHFTIIGSQGKWVTVRIKTQQMEAIGIKGIAEQYKLKKESNLNFALDKWLKDVKEQITSPITDTVEFIDEFRLNLFATEIYTFTPKGETITLPYGATVLDFAFEIHSQLAYKCIGGKINLKLVPPTHKLKNGDQVEILTAINHKLKPEWIDYVITAKAKNYIKQIFKKERQKQIEKGKKIIASHIKKQKIANVPKYIRVALQHYNISQKPEFYYKIADEIISIADVDKIYRKKTSRRWLKYWKMQLGRTTKKLSKTHSLKDESTLYKHIDFTNSDSCQIATCCNPIPGDDIVAYISDNSKTIVHHRRCPQAIKLMSSQGEKIQTVQWTSQKALSYFTAIKIEGIDTQGIATRIMNQISNQLNIKTTKINFQADNGIFYAQIHLYIQSTKDLDNLIGNLKKIKSIKNIKRVENI